MGIDLSDDDLVTRADGVSGVSSCATAASTAAGEGVTDGDSRAVIDASGLLMEVDGATLETDRSRMLSSSDLLTDPGVPAPAEGASSSRQFTIALTTDATAVQSPEPIARARPPQRHRAGFAIALLGTLAVALIALVRSPQSILRGNAKLTPSPTAAAPVTAAASVAAQAPPAAASLAATTAPVSGAATDAPAPTEPVSASASGERAPRGAARASKAIPRPSPRPSTPAPNASSGAAGAVPLRL